MNWMRGCLYAGAVAMVASSLACDTRAKAEGAEGNLQFYYVPADGGSRFDRPLAVGSGMLLYMEAIGERSLDEVIAVSATPQQVLSVDLAPGQTEAPAVSVSGMAPGTGRVNVEVRGGGERYTDSTELRVAEVHEVSLTHGCTEGSMAAYLLGESVSLGLERKSREGEVLIGATRSTAEARRSCQVQMEPDFFQDRGRCDEAGLHFSRHVFDRAETLWVDVASGVQVDRRGHRELGVQIVEAEMIDFEAADADLRVDATRHVQLHPYTFDNDWPVCSNLSMRVFIETPYICTGENGSVEFDVEPADENRFALRGRREGYCEFTVVLMQAPHIEFVFDAYVEDLR